MKIHIDRKWTVGCSHMDFSGKDMSLLRQHPASDEGHEGADRQRFVTPSLLGKQSFREVESAGDLSSILG